MTALEAVQTMQLAIAMIAFVALDFWFPAIKKIAQDVYSGQDQIIMIVPLWRILIGTLGAVAGALTGFFPYIVMNAVVAFGFAPSERPLWPTVIGQAFLFLCMIWFASWGKAATIAIRKADPSPWHVDDHLDWVFIIWVGVIVMILSATLVKAQALT